MKKYDDDNPIREVGGSNYFDEVNSFELNDEYNYTNLNNSDLNNSDLNNTNLNKDVSYDEKENPSKVFFKYFSGILVFWGIFVIAYAVYPLINQIYEEIYGISYEEKYLQEVEDNIAETPFQEDNSMGEISFIGSEVIPTIHKYGSYKDKYESKFKTNDTRFNGSVSTYEMKYEELSKRAIKNYVAELLSRQYENVGKYENADIYVKNSDANDFTCVIIGEDYVIYGYGKGDYKTTFNLE